MGTSSKTPRDTLTQVIRQNYDLLMKWSLYTGERPTELAEADELVIAAIAKLVKALQKI